MADDNEQLPNPPPADATDDEKRRALEEFQRQQAEQAVKQSQINQPADEVQNAVQRLAQQAPSQPSDYTERGLPVSNTVFGQQLSPQEQNFWAANPLGAVIDRRTGAFIGLGNDESTRQARLQQADISPVGATGYQPPSPNGQSEPPPNFINIPEVDPALQERRNQIQAALDENANRLRGASTNVPRGSHISEYGKLSLERNQLQHAYDSLGHEIRFQTQQQAAATHQNTQMQLQHQIDTDTTNANKLLGQLRAPLGSDERTQALAQIQAQYPMARRDREFNARYLDEVKQNADHAAYLQLARQSGIVPQLTHSGPQGPSYNYKPEAQQELSPYGLSPVQIKNAQGVELGTIGKKTTENPTGFTGGTTGDTIRLDTGKQTAKGEPIRVNIPLSLYQKYGGQLAQPQATATPQPQPQQQQFSAAPTNPADRQPNNVYVTPRGNLKWTGTGWVNP